MPNRNVPCGKKDCYAYSKLYTNRCAEYWKDQDTLCDGYFVDPTELAIQINDGGGNEAPKNRGDK